MKSYEGYTGIGSSSRKRDERLVVEEHAVVVDRLGGNQREVEIVPSASARRMSAPTSRPAVVVVGPNSEFSTTISSNVAPVASSRLLEQLAA